MRVYEFNGINVQAELIRLHNRKTKTNESKQDGFVYISSFLSAAEGCTVAEDHLVIGNYYFPIEVMYDSAERKVTMLIVTQPARYIGLAGSRLEFRYDTSNKPLLFPTDEYLTTNERRFVFSSKDELDKIVSLAEMKFSNTEWDFQALGFDQTGAIRRITNIG